MEESLGKECLLAPVYSCMKGNLPGCPRLKAGLHLRVLRDHSFGFNLFLLEKRLRHKKARACQKGRVHLNFFQPLYWNGPIELLHFSFDQ